VAVSREKLQELLKQEMRKIYSETVIDHSMNPRNTGGLDNADGYAKITGPCGDTIEMWLKVKDNTIRDAGIITDGCSTTVAASSMVTEMAKGRTASEAQRISQRDILDALGGLPEDNEHCALLASNTLKEAIRDYLAMKREPWKKVYRQH